jgi:hypothetical protein
MPSWHQNISASQFTHHERQPFRSAEFNAVLNVRPHVFVERWLSVRDPRPSVWATAGEADAAEEMVGR